MQIPSGALRSFVVVLALVVLGALVFASAAVARSSSTVSTKMSGKKQVPRVFTEGQGTAEIKLDPDAPPGMQLCYEIKVSDLSSPATEAHIHEGPRRFDGPRVAELDPPAEGESSGCVAVIEPETIEAISKHPRRFYVAIHTVEFPEGEVRGNLKRGPLRAG